MTQPPPPRFKIVEQDRRLVVIDTWRTERPDAAAQTPQATPGLARTAFDRRATLSTAAWYDAKGPRTITLGPEAAKMLQAWPGAVAAAVIALVALFCWQPWLIVPVVVLLTHRSVRRAARDAITHWLDRVAE